MSDLTFKIKGEAQTAACLFSKSFEERAGFKNIELLFSPVTNASTEEIENWISVIKDRCPINDKLANPTPLSFNLVKELVTI